MKRFLMLGSLVLLVAAGALWWTKRAETGGASQTPTPSKTETTAPAAQAGSANDSAISPPEEQAASDRTAAPESADRQAEPSAPSLAQLLEYRRLAADLNKMHGADADDSNAQVAAWPVDSDSLLAKYAALDKAGVTKVLADIHGLIEWQGRGPFENKQAEVLPYRIMLALETEREWLQSRLGDL